MLIVTLFPVPSDVLAQFVNRRDELASDLVRIGWFGLDGPGADETTLAFAETWAPAVRPLLVMAGWTALAASLARRSMRWEPRT